jgi:hypothetical protein
MEIRMGRATHPDWLASGAKLAAPGLRDAAYAPMNVSEELDRTRTAHH